MTGEGEPVFTNYPPDFFDFIVIDECHRGGANDESTWRKILEHFEPVVQLGLTATPKRRHNADTYAYFGEPIYTYALRDGIEDGYLTPFKVRQMASTIDEYVYVPEDDVIQGEVDTGRREQDWGGSGTGKSSQGNGPPLLRVGGPCPAQPAAARGHQGPHRDRTA